MKPFNLEEALSGKPVIIRAGLKAYVVGKIPSHITYDDKEPIDFPLVGIVLDENGYLTDQEIYWTMDGERFGEDVLHDGDIIGMAEETTGK